MPRNRMPGHDGPGNEDPLSTKLVKAALKRWVNSKLKEGDKMPNPFNLPDKPMGKSMTILILVLYLLGNIMTRVADGLSTGNWDAFADWLQSGDFWDKMAFAGIVFGLRRSSGSTTPVRP